MDSTASGYTEKEPAKIILPLKGILKEEDGSYAAIMNGVKIPVVYFSDVRCWFLLKRGRANHYDIVAPIMLSVNGEWLIANSPEEARRQSPSDGIYEEIILPSIAAISGDLKAIPSTVHIIWIGDRPLPDYLLDRIKTNTLRCPSFRFILHVHPTTRRASRRLKVGPRHFGRVFVSDLRQDAAFLAFLGTEAGACYSHFLKEPHKNYGAASDLLRYFILHDRGGVYMDADDEITTQVAMNYQLMAPRQHVLLGMCIRISEIPAPFYSNSNFACHAGCSVMSYILNEAVSGLQKNKDFLQKSRPWCTAPDKLATHTMQDYIIKILELTGPLRFTRALIEKKIISPHIEDDYFNSFEILFVTPGRPRIIADTYEEQMLNSLAFYFPFSSPNFHIRPGCASTWNLERPDQTKWFQDKTCL
ncbi:glycosyltransferase [Escherichia fergusonii]|uniref:glycosyltransferase n=1 Tax=Escherichia fergusonii TaxID=564 RepID=UPI00159B9B07|nr:glycosyltransferase [Escherichia fergusonii]